MGGVDPKLRLFALHYLHCVGLILWFAFHGAQPGLHKAHACPNRNDPGNQETHVESRAGSEESASVPLGRILLLLVIR